LISLIQFVIEFILERRMVPGLVMAFLMDYVLEWLVFGNITGFRDMHKANISWWKQHTHHVPWYGEYFKTSGKFAVSGIVHCLWLSGTT